MHSYRITLGSLDKEQLSLLKRQAVGDRPYAGRISIALAFRLIGITAQSLDRFAVLDELEYLEGLRGTSKAKGEQQFKHPPLFTFWHKHFFSARHLAANVMVRWNLGGNGNGDLDTLLREIQEKYGDEPDLWPNQLAHKLVVGGFEERCGRGLTGDWVVYAKHKGENYYLDLATHSEGVGIAAENLHTKLKQGCSAEFPFLFPQGGLDQSSSLSFP